ncbi:choice-of-anchor I family protein [Desertifilum sp. FACHB-1129]|uniref:Uncharacterized protein n=1 Tax=Desertifilum tharense IPPAS B-1220 TaxID=1781255 RepID=A0A1E5QR51_9CYAN|nr:MULTISPECIES: choice-of-anchor I family protein [Desertifilum]MDA0212604.1 choice-of-anchor I family protein [Cyanobacteria bacterium FC1]MBD2315171.1 choice-of-anchor I family protein [Desertifilum sp. FACHB-1129]MBD2324029.1 choice-of-anchor I family protein [Desertifilum sp. FACHB-866]MBD2333964.1 choice-of-anchor I family protein [Desertifilum sp. FACHB-868]OEJ77132.1 hypothetical protein BH720_00845 [Desertifilum tharense IPPAS B-1220]
MAIINGTPGNDLLVGTPEADLIFALPGNDTVFGQEGDDQIYGNQGSDLLFGNQGNDTLYGGKDNDTLYGGRDNDVLFGNTGDDWINGNLGDDTIYGGKGNDVIRGGKGNDRIFGDRGNDVLYGDRGNDTLTGGEGRDLFVLQAGLEGTNTITDFTPGEDLIGLAGGLSFANLEITQQGSATAIRDRNSGTTLAILQGINATQLSAADFTTNLTPISTATPAPTPTPSIVPPVRPPIRPQPDPEPQPEPVLDSIELSVLGTYATGVYNQGAAEIPAYDPVTQRLFVVNANSATVDIIDASNPSNLSLIKSIDIPALASGFGDANSVAVNNGIVAVAVENENKQAPGSVVFFDTDGNALKIVQVGALPDMLTFTPDGTKVLVANEGEPNDDYTVDPEGSVSIINIANGVANATVTTADFRAFNARREELIASGVRIFGPNATVAQDVEPEYIAVTSDSKTAFIALQENNAIARLDLTTGQITDIFPLGYKDHSAQLSLNTYFFAEESLPVLDTVAGRDIRLGGFSALYYEGKDATTQNLKFVTVSDRGLGNTQDAQGNRIFLIPDFQPALVRFELTPNGTLEITEQIGLKRPDGTPLTVIPNLPGRDPDLPAVDPQGNPIPPDPLGIDAEGVVIAPDGTFWIVDEYRPSIYHFAADGTLIERYVPEGLPSEVGTPALPADYAKRRPNRGFEAVAYEDGKIYAFMQSPLQNPVSTATATIRILEFDVATKTTTGEYLYIQEDVGNAANDPSDKIGDAVALGNGQFLVIERDSGFGQTSQKKVFRINLNEATNLQTLPSTVLEAGETFDSLTPAQLATKNIKPVPKEIYADLTALGYDFTDKPEGLALIDEGTIAVLNDNDFGDNPTIRTGLGIIRNLNVNNGLDASDRDGGINIRNWPIFGMYQPDAIAVYERNGQTFIVTANEGDARAYSGFNEEVRVGQLTLNPEFFPDAAALKLNSALGRLRVTNALGDTNGNGQYEELYAFGGRSFSIFRVTATGLQLVYDSGNDFERITAELIPNYFNSTNSENNSFDTRSDDKGPEPEGVVLGTVGDRTFAFIGLERVGGVMTYDITDPFNPLFVQYINNRDFTGNAVAGTAKDLGPEGLIFIPGSDSPIANPLLAVANEISGTTTLFEITPTFF